MATIVFNKPIRIPSNYQNFSDNEMSITIKPSSYEDADLKNFGIESWDITKMSRTIMNI